MGYIRTNHRLVHGEAHQVSFQQTLAELVELMGAAETAEYLAKYPTAKLKVYAAEVKLRSLKTEQKEATR